MSQVSLEIYELLFKISSRTCFLAYLSLVSIAQRKASGESPYCSSSIEKYLLLHTPTESAKAD